MWKHLLIIHNLKNIEADLLTVNIPSLFLGNVFNAISTGVTNGMKGLRVGIKGTTAVTTGAFVVGCWRGGSLGLVVTTTGGLSVRMRGLRVVVVGTLTGGVIFLVGGGFSGCCCCCRWDPLAVTGGLIVVVVLFWSEPGILLPPLLLLFARRGLSRSWRVNYHLWDWLKGEQRGFLFKLKLS